MSSSYWNEEDGENIICPYCGKEYEPSYEVAKMTNADRIRNMSDEKLAEWICFMYETESCGEPFRSIYNFNTDEEEGIHDSYEDWLDWLQSDAE